MPGLCATATNPWIDRQLAFWSPGWVLGGCAVTLVAAGVARRRTGQAGEMPSWATTAYVIALGGVLTWTLSPRSPGDRYFRFGATARSCSLWRDDIAFAVTTAEWQFNLLLFVPLGVICAFARGRRTRVAMVGVVALVPVAVEAAQYSLSSLHRVCSGTDIVTNWLGLLASHVATRIVLRLRSHVLALRSGRPPARIGG
jgi:VanZ like family